MRNVLILVFILASFVAMAVHFMLGAPPIWLGPIFVFAFLLFSILSGLAGPEYSVIGWIKDRLVPDAFLVWKRWSIQIAASQVVLISVWAALSTVGLTPEVPEWIKTAVVFLFSSAAVTAAFLQQKNLPPPGGV